MLRHEGTDFDEERRRGLSGELRLESGIEAIGDEVGRAAADATARWAHTFATSHTLELSGYGLWTDTVDYEESARTPTSFLRGYNARPLPPRPAARRLSRVPAPGGPLPRGDILGRPVR